MKFYHLLNKSLLLFIFVLISFSYLSHANSDIEQNLKQITSKLRCMTCQNQTIYSSEAEFSNYIKKIVRDKLENNESEKEIIDYLIYRYGEYISFEPKINKQNLFLWIFPFMILAISLGFLMFRIKKNL